jgi:hypothetical protein
MFIFISYEYTGYTEYHAFFCCLIFLLERERNRASCQLFCGRGLSLVLHLGFILRHALIDFIGGVLAGIAILFLEQAGENIELAA